MLGTVLGFSFPVIEAGRKVELGLTREQGKDFLYLWRVFARIMGIHPPGLLIVKWLFPNFLRIWNMFRARLDHILTTHRELPVAEFMSKVVDDVKAHVGSAPQSDDITLVVVRRPR